MGQGVGVRHRDGAGGRGVSPSFCPDPTALRRAFGDGQNQGGTQGAGERQPAPVKAFGPHPGGGPAGN